MEITTKYFTNVSQETTSEVLERVRQFLKEHIDIEQVVVATTEGTTGLLFAKAFGAKTIVVTHHTGFRQPNFNEIDPDKKKQTENQGATVLTTTHAFAGIARGIRNALQTYSTTEILAYAYRTFGQGTKVCAEIAMMAADAGLVPVDKDVICVGGTGRGADTAWLVRPTNTSNFISLKMRACICKPLDF
ncbi:MAG: hypothetical protein ACFFED_03865 [Candidatus Thorarchaeota archaeon]